MPSFVFLVALPIVEQDRALAGGEKFQPIRSASITMIPSGPRT
jgi:hypothetical protein